MLLEFPEGEPLIYLASPYSHPDPMVREARFQAACRQAAELMRCGISVFSPIVYSHSIVAYGLPADWATWERLDRAILEICSEVLVLALDGWRESEGVQAEIEVAKRLGKPVVVVEPDSLFHGPSSLGAGECMPAQGEF
jgi:hypothetical protein